MQSCKDNSIENNIPSFDYSKGNHISTTSFKYRNDTLFIAKGRSGSPYAGKQTGKLYFIPLSKQLKQQLVQLYHSLPFDSLSSTYYPDESGPYFREIYQFAFTYPEKQILVIEDTYEPKALKAMAAWLDSLTSHESLSLGNQQLYFESEMGLFIPPPPPPKPVKDSIQHDIL